MLIMGEQKASQLSLCIKAAPLFLLSGEKAVGLIANQVKTIKKSWREVCDAASLAEVDRNFLWGRQFLNAYAFADAPEEVTALAQS